MIQFSSLSKVLEEEIKKWDGKTAAAFAGFVTQVGDSVASVYGLDGAVYGELVEFASGASGVVLNLEEDGVGCVLLSGENLVKDGEEVRGTGKVLSVPVGPGIWGRVVNPLGTPLDGRGPVPAEKHLPVESPAPPVIERGSVDTPLQTGILSVDAMIPIGRGQRELIIGDRQTGKTALAVDTIINQKGKGVYCVYCAIGQKASTVAAIIQNLEKHGALDYTFVVLASASDSAALQYLAPYSACAMAEHFMNAGKDVLIVYDDLSKHAVAYRTISLLLRRPPGREAFPGDVFYLHSRLLERAAKLSPERGGGSITAIPIVETQAGDISSYIPTNVISITDGQIFLDTELFNSGFRPAIDVGLSVSRVGGAAQSKAVRKFSGHLRLDLAQYREIAAFAQFGSDLDKATQEKLAQGERLMEILKQNQFSPLPMEKEAVVLFAAVNGFLIDIPVGQVRTFIAGLLEYLSVKHHEILKSIAETGAVQPEQEKELFAAAKAYDAKLRNQAVDNRPGRTTGIAPGDTGRR
jgi:F-type H+-transporting ATPase subunit alpha